MAEASLFYYSKIVKNNPLGLSITMNNKKYESFESYESCDVFIEYDDTIRRSKIKLGNEDIQLMENGVLNSTGLNSKDR